MSKWNKKLFGEVATTSKGRLTLQSEAKEQDFLPLINTDAVNGKPSLYGYSKGAVLCDRDDVLMLWDGERSGLVAIGYTGVVGSTFAKLSPNDIIDSKYLFYFLDSKFHWIQGQRTGTGVPHVPKNLEKILWVKYPENKTEQQQIAKILSTADAVIEKTQATVAKYKAIKQGMLQDLFTRGIDLSTNKLRPSYQDAPELYKECKLGMIPREWEVERLGNRATIEYGKSQKAVVSLNGTIPVYGTGGLMEYATDFLYDGESILIGRKGTIDKPFYINGKFWTVDTAYYLTSFTGNVRWLHSQLEYYNLRRLNEATGVPSINRETLYNIFLAFPDKPEQDEVEKRIVAIDNKLQTEQNYLQKMQSLKKGLMEDLLSGRKQVKVSEELVMQKEN